MLLTLMIVKRKILVMCYSLDNGQDVDWPPSDVAGDDLNVPAVASVLHTVYMDEVYPADLQQDISDAGDAPGGIVGVDQTRVVMDMVLDFFRFRHSCIHFFIYSTILTLRTL